MPTGGITAGIRAHRRQFVLAADSVRAGPDWTAREIAPGRVLSHCPDLRVAEARDAEGGAWLLLGHALATEPDRPDPPGDLSGLATRDVPALTHGWAGRWLLIGPRLAVPDAAALLGCYHGRDDEGGLVVTSSPALGRTSSAAPSRARWPTRAGSSTSAACRGSRRR